MPGLQLTPWQAQRLWGLDAKACDDALKALVEGAFLHRTPAAPTAGGDPSG